MVVDLIRMPILSVMNTANKAKKFKIVKKNSWFEPELQKMTAIFGCETWIGSFQGIFFQRLCFIIEGITLIKPS